MARTKSMPNRAEKIIEAADELFGRYGYERTSIDDVAKHLGIGKGSIYLEFRTKEDILFAILRRHADRLFFDMQEKVENCSGSPLQTLREVIEETALNVYDRVTRDIHTPESLLHTSITKKSRCADFFVRKRTLMLKLLEMAAQADEISPKYVNEGTTIALLMAFASFFPPYFNNYTEDTERISRQEMKKQINVLMDLLIAGLQAGK